MVPETWTMRKDEIDRLQAFEMSAKVDRTRIYLNITTEDKTSDK